MVKKTKRKDLRKKIEKLKEEKNSSD